MTDADEIERLRKLLSDTNTYYAECIAEREELRAENEKLRAALKPFAHEPKAGAIVLDMNRTECVLIRLSSVRAAAAALKETGDELRLLCGTC